MKPRWLRLPPPLRLTIPALVLAFNVCFVGITAAILVYKDYHRETKREVSLATSQVRRLAPPASRVLGPDHHPADEQVFQAELDVVAATPLSEWVLFCRANGEILHSSRREWIGSTVAASLSQDAANLVASAIAEKRSQPLIQGGRSVLVAHPVAFTSGAPPSAAILMQSDLATPLAAVRRHAIHDILLATGIMLLAGLGLWLALRGYLRARIKALLESTHAAPKGGAAPMLQGGDEFAEIARALRASEDRFGQLATSIQDVFYMVSADRGTMIYVSPSYEEVWGRSVAALKESPNDWLAAVEEPEREEVMRHHDPLYHGADSVQMEYRIRRPDGTVRWIENRAFPVHDESGRLHCIAGLARDVTSRKEMERDLLNATEHERRRIGSDLHDDLCQRLVAIKLKCGLLADALKCGGRPDPALADQLCQDIAEATFHCRGIARGLSPVDLAGDGLMIALGNLVSSMEKLHDVACFFHCPETVIIGSTRASVHLYRITQEFMNNAVRHGRPERIDVRLEVTGGNVRIEVVNDGQPFQEPGPHNQGMGLKILHYRAGAIGATIRIHGRSDGIPGTIAVCQAPVSSQSSDTPTPTIL